jgi:hypothetical protein
MMIYDYAGGRKFNAPERFLFSTATYDERLAAVMEAFGSRSIGPLQMMARGIPLATLARLRRSRAGSVGRGGAAPSSGPLPTAAGGGSSARGMR